MTPSAPPHLPEHLEDTPRRVLRRVQHDDIGLQIAPMIDVTMLLLFFFMLTGKMSQSLKLLQVDLPTAATALEQKDKSDRDVVNIDENGQLYAGDEALSDREMSDYLKMRLKEHPPLKIYVRADARTPGKRIKQVMAMAADAGAVTVIFAAFTR
jgi:biopolymer transport protein ExbD